MKEILKKAEEILELEKAETEYLAKVLELLRKIKGKSRPNTSADQNVS